MANNIKGLTVEIGGDTTKLGKALADVEKKSRDLSGELGQINKLLKLDPGNTTLLAQKQKVLAEAVETTGEKLKKLKEAEKQVQQQFKRGEVSEEQVRALQREIVQTEKKMDSYKKAIKETSQGLNKLDDSTKKAERSSDGLGSKLGSIAKGGAKLLAAGVAAVTGALVASAEASREYRREMGKLDTAFTTAGHSSEAAKNTYKTLQGVLGETDQAVEAANHLAKLTDNEKDLQEWTDICTGVYATFGASLPIEGLTEAANETAKVGAVTGPLADALNWAGVSEDQFNESLAACNSEQERQKLIMETLSGLYDDAANKYKETNAEVIRANQANEEWAESVAGVGAEVEPLLTDVKLLGASLIRDLVPGVKEVAGAFRGMLNGDEGAAANLGEAFSGIFSQLLNKITEIVPKIAEVGLSLITTLTTSIVQSIPQLINTLSQVAQTLVQGITAAIPQLTAALVATLPDIVQACVDLVKGLVQAIPQIIPPLIAAIPQIAMAIANALIAAIPQLIQGAVQFLMAIIQAIPQVIPPLIAAIPPLVTTLVDGLIAAIPVLIEGALQLLMAIVDAIPLIIPPLIDAIPQIVTTLVEGLRVAIPQLLDGAVQLLMAILDAIPVLLDALIPALPMIIDTIISAVIDALPLLLNAAVQLFMAVVQAIPKIIGPLVKQLPTIISTITGTLLKNLPLLISAAIKLFYGIIEAIPKIIVELGRQMPNIIKAIVAGLKQGVTNIKQVGKDLVKGLWNGIKDMVGWITGKLEGFGDSVLKGIKNFFGIKSPSRVFKNEVGKMLAVGLAEGIEDNAKAPLDAMSALSGDLLGEADQMNGLTIERRLNSTFAPPETAGGNTGLLAKLDKILAAIEAGQILALDGDAIVGATANKMDSALGRRRALAARGAI